MWYNAPMNISLILAAVALVPQPAKLVETGGMTKNAEIRHVTDSAVPAEGYRLKVAADGITVTSSDEAGRFYAGVTLAQLKDSETLPICSSAELITAPRGDWLRVTGLRDDLPPANYIGLQVLWDN